MMKGNITQIVMIAVLLMFLTLLAYSKKESILWMVRKPFFGKDG